MFVANLEIVTVFVWKIWIFFKSLFILLCTMEKYSLFLVYKIGVYVDQRARNNL